MAEYASEAGPVGIGKRGIYERVIGEILKSYPVDTAKEYVSQQSGFGPDHHFRGSFVYPFLPPPPKY